MIDQWLAATLAASSLAMASTTIALARRVRASDGAWEALAKRVDDLSLRVRMVESAPARSASRSIRTRGQAPATRAPVESGRRVDGPAALISVPSLASSGSEEVRSEAAAELERRFGPVWELADAGESHQAIARAVGLGVGQVELILGLRKPLAQPSDPADA